MSSSRQTQSSQGASNRNVKLRVVRAVPLTEPTSSSLQQVQALVEEELVAMISQPLQNQASHKASKKAKKCSRASLYVGGALPTERTMADGTTCTSAVRPPAPPAEESRTFPEIVHAMVAETARNDPSIMDWVNDGEAFVIKQPESSKLSGVLQRYFRHGKYSSLQRQLNMYGWSKCLKGKHKGAFYNKHFHRDCQNTAALATLIQRRDNLRRTPNTRKQSAKKTSAAKKVSLGKLRSPRVSDRSLTPVPPVKKVTPLQNEATPCAAATVVNPVLFMSEDHAFPMTKPSSFHKGKLLPKFSPAMASRASFSPHSHHLPAKKRPVLLGIDPFEGIQVPGLHQTTPARHTNGSVKSDATPQTFVYDQHFPKHMVLWSPLLLENAATPGTTLMAGPTSASMSPSSQNESDIPKSFKAPRDVVGLERSDCEEALERNEAATALASMASSSPSQPPEKPFLFSPTLHRSPPRKAVDQTAQQIEHAPPLTSLIRAGSSSYAPLPLLRYGSSSQYLLPFAGMVADALGTGQEQQIRESHGDAEGNAKNAASAARRRSFC